MGEVNAGPRPCQSATPLTGLGDDGALTVEWRVCGAPAAGQVTGGCVHEHIRTIWVCSGHQEDWLSKEIGCIACFEAGHECQMAVRPVSRATEKGG